MNNKLEFALEQKELLLIKISDLTKQMEVRSKQQEIQMEDLPAQRQVLLDRIKKCCLMIDGYVDTLPEEERSRTKKILSCEIPQEECGPDEQVLLKRSLNCLSLLRTVVAENSIAVGRMKKERDRLQTTLSSLHKSTGSPSDMFHSR
mgnify:CR=1 FL=1